MTKRFIIIGKEGYIAQKLAERLTKENREYLQTSFEPVNKDLYLQLEDPETFNYDIITKNDFVVLLAAISAPDVCKNQYEYAYNINVTGTKKFISQCVKKGARVLFVSSDTVLGKADGTVNEDTTPNPFGKYAEMKNEVEAVFRDNSNVKTFRLSYIFSKLDKFSQYVLSCVENNRTIEIFHPFSRRVVYIQDLLQAIINLSDMWDSFSHKICHIVGPELLSRKDIVDSYLQVLQSTLTYTIIEDDDEFFKDRARIIDMDSLFLNQLLGKKQTTILEAIKMEFGT